MKFSIQNILLNLSNVRDVQKEVFDLKHISDEWKRERKRKRLEMSNDKYEENRKNTTSIGHGCVFGVW